MHKWDEPPFSTEPLPSPINDFEEEDKLSQLENLNTLSFFIEQSGIGK